jgi:23S rRNA (adenine2503-C2)-methyltransferase
VYDLPRRTLERLFTEWAEPSYRVQQLWEWLYVHLADSFDAMTNLSTELREKLDAQLAIETPQVISSLLSSDEQTRKDLLGLASGKEVEAVLMYYHHRRTACISTQVGCSVGCVFCATGQGGFQRNLTAGEIVAQALHFARILHSRGESLTNVVLMGMGEPLLNYEASLEAIRRLVDQTGFRMGQRHVTLSTIGIVPGIDRLAEEGLQITLAVSLHAASDELREQLVPVNNHYPLDEVFAACRRYLRRTGRRISFEWVLIGGVNDTPEQAEALAKRLRGGLPIAAHINLIPLNPTAEYGGQPPSPESTAAFTRVLDSHEIPYTVRLRRGVEIQAGCGQLRWPLGYRPGHPAAGGCDRARRTGRG